MCSVGVCVLRHTIFITTVIPYVWYDTISICVFRCPQSKRDQAEVHGHGARGRPQQHRLGRRIDASVYRCSRRCVFFIRGVLLKKWKVLVHRSGGWKEKVEESYKYSQSQRLTYYLVRSTCYSWCILWSKDDTKLAKISFWGKKCCVFLFQAISQPSFFFFLFYSTVLFINVCHTIRSVLGSTIILVPYTALARVDGWQCWFLFCFSETVYESIYTRYSFVRAKRVSNSYTPKKKNLCVRLILVLVGKKIVRVFD